MRKSVASSQFIVTSVVNGASCRVLYDTGASACFVRTGHPLLAKAAPSSDDSVSGISVVVKDSRSVGMDRPGKVVEC